MNNKEFLNICYKFLNRFINTEELIRLLDTLDKKGLLKEEREQIDTLLNDIKTIYNNTSNEEDEYGLKKKEKIGKVIKSFEQIQTSTENRELLDKQITNLKKDYNKKYDSNEMLYAITDCINNNKYFNACYDNLSDYELLEFIAQYIHAPFPPQIDQEVFDALVKVGIENDEREWLWRLAYNYEERNINFDLIVDYFIEKKDAYYLSELISAVGECLNIDNIIDKINDKELIKELLERKDVLNKYISEEQFNKLKN